MKSYTLFLLLPISTLIFTGCGGQGNSNNDRYQAEITLHQVRSDIEELKHDLNSQQMQLNILEGKSLNHEDTLSTVRRETIDAGMQKIDALRRQVIAADKKIAFFEAKLSEAMSELRSLTNFASETTRALTQYKEKMVEVEKTIALQNQALEEVLKIKQSIRDYTAHKGQMPKEAYKVYQVETGDSLGKIAAKFQTTASHIQAINKLETDRINAGQDLLVPKVESE